MCAQADRQTDRQAGENSLALPHVVTYPYSIPFHPTLFPSLLSSKLSKQPRMSARCTYIYIYISPQSDALNLVYRVLRCVEAVTWVEVIGQALE